MHGLPVGHLKDTIVWLGCFQTLTNLLGAIGNLMEGSGHDVLLE